ncbi:hypothetical protein MMC29_005384, partial [Sticta canariensis]|nr:hypothetical protein [Sticta canariensis]
MAQRRRWMIPSVLEDIQDDTNYLAVGSGELQPGVRLSSSWYDINQSPQMALATTSGVLLRNGNRTRMTCALSGWPDSNDVLHPQAPSGELIGVVRERYDAEDVGLVELNPSIRFTNRKYFEATPPRRLLTSAETRHMRGHWYLADGISTGCVAMLQSGISQELPQRPPGHTTIPYVRWRQETAVYSSLFAMMGAKGAKNDVADGLCGAPTVDDSGGSNGVGGFFQLADEQWCLAPCLDKLVAD